MPARPARIGILTGGGDCPGLNAVIRAVTKTAVTVFGAEVIGFRDGYHGLVFDRTLKLHYDDVSGILTRGGTILGMSRRDSFFRIPGTDRKVEGPDRTARARAVFRKHGLSCLIAVGGEGTLTVAAHLDRSGIPMVGVPKTIDNDVPLTDQTFGFDSALAVATEAVDRLHSTAESHHRVMVLEVMGRHAGWIALHAGVAGGGDIILIPEIPFSWDVVCSAVKRRARRGRKFSIVVVAEGAVPHGGRETSSGAADGIKRARLGGIGNLISQGIEKKTGLESRATVLGYLQRGGEPTPFDRVLATRYGHASAVFAARGLTGVMTALRSGKIDPVSLKLISRGRPRAVPPDSPLLAAARAVGTCFGDEHPGMGVKGA
jgi:ATP-dependent phosphofructokinase / diphosphate-dependent phosphofructokinase